VLFRVEELLGVCFGRRRIEGGEQIFFVQHGHNDFIAERNIERRLSLPGFGEARLINSVASPRQWRNLSRIFFRRHHRRLSTS
jgi:hypothetical protein